MTEKKAGIRDYLSKIGPAVIVSMTIIGPGTMSALVTSGSGWYFSFFWAVILSIVFAYVATWISTKLTCVTGLSPVEALKKHTWGWLAWVLVIFNFVTQFCVMVAQGRGLRTAVITLSQVGGSEGLSSGASNYHNHTICSYRCCIFLGWLILFCAETNQCYADCNAYLLRYHIFYRVARYQRYFSWYQSVFPPKMGGTTSRFTAMDQYCGYYWWCSRAIHLCISRLCYYLK